MSVNGGPVASPTYSKNPSTQDYGGFYHNDIAYLDLVTPSTPVYVTNSSADVLTNLAASNALVVGTGGGHS